MGPKTKLTNARIERLCAAVAAGNYNKVACAYIGVTEAGFYKWLNRGEAELLRREGNVKEGTPQWKREQIFVDLVTSFKKAKATAEMKNVQVIQKAASEGTWQAAAWWLERSFPERWGRRVQVKVSWKAELRELVHSGKATVEQVGAEFGDELVAELFGGITA